MFGSSLQVSSRQDLDNLIKGDSRYLQAVQDHQFVLEDRGEPNYALGDVYYGPRYRASLKCPWGFAVWARDSNLFSEDEITNLILWVTKDSI
jgi:hypothetical protein